MESLNKDASMELLIKELHRILLHVSSFELDDFCKTVEQADRIFIGGMGRSGLIARSFAMRLMQIGKTVFIIGETVTPALKQGDLAVLVSGSGETAVLKLYAEEIHQAGGVIDVLSATRESTLSREADHVLIVPVNVPSSKRSAGTVQPMANSFEQAAFIVLDYCAAVVMRQMHSSEVEMLERHANLQ